MFQEKETADMKTTISYCHGFLLPVVGGVVGAGVAFVGAPVLLTAAGFGAQGITAGSLAAGWMSATGPVAAGSLVALGQSAGAAGLAAVTKAAIIGTGALAGKVIGGSGSEKKDKCYD